MAEASLSPGRLVQSLRRAAEVNGTSVLELCEQLIVAWAPSRTMTTNAQLAAKVSKTFRLVGGAALLPAATVAEAEPRARWRSGRLQTASQCRFLSKAQVHRAHAFASAVTQLLGWTFDIVVKIEAGGDRAPAATVSHITHGLAMFWQKRGAPKPAWVYCHCHKTGQQYTLLLIATEPASSAETTAWLKRRLMRDGLVGHIEVCADLTDTGRLAHQRRALCQIYGRLDPAISGRSSAGRPRPLVDLLDVPADFRSDLGEAFCSVALQVCPAMRRRLDALATAQNAPILDPFGEAVWSAFGWELAEWRDRRRMLASVRDPAHDGSGFRSRQRSWPIWW